MDIVGTFNHLIPSDQLEDSLLLGQNLECEASDEFASGHGFPDDSLKNMLSDKDPMFGSACTQFNLLENEEANFQLPSDQDMNTPGFSQTPAGKDETQSRFPRGRRKAAIQLQRKQTASRGRGRGGRRSGPFRGYTEPLTGKGRPDQMISEEHDESYREKREALLSRRFNVHEVEPWMNPVVVLRRLTVTVGGFKIELLPGPSHSSGSFNTGDLQSLSFHDDSVTADSNGFNTEESQALNMQPATGVAQELNVAAPEAAEPPTEFGLCVNPNDVQHTNGVTEAAANAPVDDQNDGDKPIACKAESKNDKTNKHATKKLPKLKQPQDITKSKQATNVSKPGMQSKGPKSLKPHDKKVQKLSSENPQHAKGKPPSGTPKQAPEPQKMQASHPAKQNPNPLVPDSPIAHRKPSLDSSPGSKPGLNKSPHSMKKPPTQPPAVDKQKQHVKDGPAEDDQDKAKIKKADKVLQRQRSRNSRSMSVEEPELFVPDNAPAVKKGPSEGDPPPAAENEAAWESSKQCRLCSKPHSNRFMVGCGRCDDWFHGDCVGLDLAKVQQMEKDDQEYVCLKCCADEDGKGADTSDKKSAANQKPGHEPAVTAGGIRPFRKDSGDRRPSTDSALKTGTKHEVKKAKISVPSSKKPSTGQIRRSVRDSLEDILLKRLKESDLKISKEKPAELAKATEKELFALFQGVDSKYKNKYRSLMFNLRDTKNNVLFKRVLQGEISPTDLVRMSAEELASKELAAWRQRENRHTIEMIEREQREVERRPVTKITHKGEIEIENQEPAKAPEIMSDPTPKAAELAEEKIPESKPESPKKSKDTTSMHKSHLFDLHCKICTGRMAPPVEEATSKVVKVATTVIKRQSTVTEGDNQEAKTISPPAASSALVDDLSLRAMEEGLLNFPAYEPRSESVSSKEDTVAFLANLNGLWAGYVDMPAVARYLTKAYPVSGILDQLTEELPESIQVGGRISPQMVWDYVEKIRASGTKEICVVRFAPDTEEDEISYTLLYAYFSSRRRYGVVANNRKQVKDMYLIPLGSTEKIPHHIVPFDGPGLETNRPNLLLGLIIRQRPKKDFGVSETSSFLESKPQEDPMKPVEAQSEEKEFTSSLGRIPKKDSTDLKTPAVVEPCLEMDDEENVSLRFLPGVLMQPKSEKAAPAGDGVKNATSAADSPTTTADAAASGSITPKTPTTPRLDRFIIKKKEPKPVPVEDGATSANAETCSQGTAQELSAQSSLAFSLKDKPGDVSTEAFLTSLSSTAASKEPDNPEEKSDGSNEPSTQPSQKPDLIPESFVQPPAVSASSTTDVSSQETADIPQKDLQASSTNTPEPAQESEPPPNTSKTFSKVSPSVPSEPLPSTQSVPAQPPPEFKAVEDIQNITTISFTGKNDGLKQSRPRLLSPKPFTTPSHGPPPPTFPPYHAEHVYHPGPVPTYPPQANMVPFMPLLSQAPPPFSYPPAPPPPMIFPHNDPLRQMHGLPWPQPVPPQACFPQLVPEGVAGPPSSYAAPRFPDSSLPSLAKADKGSELWDRKKDSRDHYGRHRHKTQHQEQERLEARSRSQSRGRSRSRSRSRHKSRHSHEDRHGERRHHSSHHRDRDRDKHRRDSDHEKHRRDSRDQHS